ncbi:hypothetical protein TNCV_4084011 [Trichonephila clavipes]|nr:hypothetical protein TNCV_4084011 [Trichonephila clavipes]
MHPEEIEATFHEICLQRLKISKVVKPPLAAIQAEIRRGIDSIRSLMTPCGRSCHSLCICAVNSPVSQDGCSCLPSASRHALLAKDLVTWQAMVGRHILEDIVGKSRAVCGRALSC